VPLRPGVRSGTAPAGAAASLGARAGAGFVDLLVLGLVDTLVVYLTMKICGVGADGLTVLPKIPLAGFFLLQNGAYLVGFTAVGQTLGKMAFGLRVVPADGSSRMEPGRSVVRALVWMLMAIPAGLGFVSTLLDPDRRGWHDRCAHTRVVRTGAA
jgi:uncharacterized RDD family membrane protein YckC